MIKINDEFSFEWDVYSWQLTQYMEGKDKDGKANEYTNIRFRERLAGFGEPAAPSEEAASGEPTAKEIFAMSEEELVALNDEWNLNLDEAKYNTWDAYAKALVKEGGFTD